MLKSNAVISGSFLLQCILDETWDGSDIDFYVDICELVKFNSSEIVMQRFFTNICKTIDKPSNYANNDFYNKVLNYEINNQKIQLCCVKSDGTISDYIKSECDFNICANVYYPNNTLEIKSLYNILSKNVYLNKSKDIMFKNIKNTIYRLTKYESRGFHFNDITLNELLDEQLKDVNIYKIVNPIENFDFTIGSFLITNNKLYVRKWDTYDDGFYKMIKHDTMMITNLLDEKTYRITLCKNLECPILKRKICNNHFHIFDLKQINDCIIIN